MRRRPADGATDPHAFVAGRHLGEHGEESSFAEPTATERFAGTGEIVESLRQADACSPGTPADAELLARKVDVVCNAEPGWVDLVPDLPEEVVAAEVEAARLLGKPEDRRVDLEWIDGGLEAGTTPSVRQRTRRPGG
jgi:hypothetical protein